jgi:hypothetical protein
LRYLQTKLPISTWLVDAAILAGKVVDRNDYPSSIVHLDHSVPKLDRLLAIGRLKSWIVSFSPNFSDTATFYPEGDSPTLSRYSVPERRSSLPSWQGTFRSPQCHNNSFAATASSSNIQRNNHRPLSPSIPIAPMS